MNINNSFKTITTNNNSFKIRGKNKAETRSTSRLRLLLGLGALHERVEISRNERQFYKFQNIVEASKNSKISEISEISKISEISRISEISKNSKISRIAEIPKFPKI